MIRSAVCSDLEFESLFHGDLYPTHLRRSGVTALCLFGGGDTWSKALNSFRREGRKWTPNWSCRGDLPTRIRNVDDKDDAAPRIVDPASGLERHPRSLPFALNVAELYQEKKARKRRSFSSGDKSSSQQSSISTSLEQKYSHRLQILSFRSCDPSCDVSKMILLFASQARQRS